MNNPNHARHMENGVSAITLTHRDGSACECLVDTIDYPLIKTYRWSPARSRRTRYAQTSIRKADGRRAILYMHRALLPLLEQIDHRDGNGLNNRRSNLREATHAQNASNSIKTGTFTSSKFKGVSYDKREGNFEAYIEVGGKHIHLGHFHNETDAAMARDSASLKYHGEFAVLNLQASRAEIK